MSSDKTLSLEKLRGRKISEIEVTASRELKVYFECGTLLTLEHSDCCQGASIGFCLEIAEKYNGEIK